MLTLPKYISIYSRDSEHEIYHSTFVSYVFPWRLLLGVWDLWPTLIDVENVLFFLRAKNIWGLYLCPPPPRKKTLGVFFSLISGGRQHKSGKGQIRWVSGSETQNQPGLMEVQVEIYFNCSIVILGGNLNKCPPCWSETLNYSTYVWKL